MTHWTPATGDALRVADLVPLRRMLGSDSIVLRLDGHGGVDPLESMPALFFDGPIRRVLTGETGDAFQRACVEAATARQAIAFVVPDTEDEILINPVLDDQGDDCRFVVCWVRSAAVVEPPNGAVGSDEPSLGWDSLRLEDVIIRYRRRSAQGTDVVDAAPWWALPDGGLLELWPHHAHVTAMGLGHAVMQALIIDAAEAAAPFGGGPAVRIVVPSPELLSGLVPVFHGVIRSSGIEPDRLVVAVDVDLAVDPDLLPVIVHLRTFGVRIDIVGLDELTNTLHTVSDTSSLRPAPASAPEVEAGPWAASFAEALHQAA